jgi:hypothetical protein
MSKNFHEHYVEGLPPPPPARSTGIVFAVVSAIVAWFFRGTAPVLWTALAASGTFLLLALTAPNVLQPLNLVWFRFALLLNKIVSPVVMLVLFAVTMVPFGLAMQCLRDPLRAKRRPDLDSYWIERAPATPETAGDMRNQF